MSKHYVTTTTYGADGTQTGDTVSLDREGVTRDLMDATRLRDAYIVTLASGGETVKVTSLGRGTRSFRVTFADGSGEVIDIVTI